MTTFWKFYISRKQSSGSSYFRTVLDILVRVSYGFDQGAYDALDPFLDLAVFNGNCHEAALAIDGPPSAIVPNSGECIE